MNQEALSSEIENREFNSMRRDQANERQAEAKRACECDDFLI